MEALKLIFKYLWLFFVLVVVGWLILMAPWKITVFYVSLILCAGSFIYYIEGRREVTRRSNGD